MFPLQGKKALITGASRGIGAAIARRLAEQGADVAITYSSSSAAADKLVAEIRATGRKAVALVADSADAAAARQSVQQTVRELGGLDILVNNAGAARMGPLEGLSLEDVDLLLNVNLRAVVVAAQAAIPHLGHGGRIITIGSTLAERVPFAGITLYAATKAALVAFTKGLARELGPKGVTVNIVHPGHTDTDMNPADGPNAAHNVGQIPLGRYNKPSDIANAVAFLASGQAAQISGTGLTVDGGLNA